MQTQYHQRHGKTKNTSGTFGLSSGGTAFKRLQLRHPKVCQNQAAEMGIPTRTSLRLGFHVKA